jgi:hypothetical protein
MVSLKWATKVTTNSTQPSFYILMTSFVVTFLSFNSASAAAQSASDFVKMLGSGVGIIESCTGDKEPARKLADVFTRREQLRVLQPFAIEAYKKAILEDAFYIDGEWTKMDCRKFASEVEGSFRKSLDSILDRMLTAE